MTRKRTNKKAKSYLRCDCVFAAEGDVDPRFLHDVLTGRAQDFDHRVRRRACAAGRPGHPDIGGPYCNIPKDHLSGNIVLLSHKDILVNVFNGRVNETQRLLAVYRVVGRISGTEIKRLEQGDYIVDFQGSVEIIRDSSGNPQWRKILGRMKDVVRDGDVVLVRDSRDGEPLETEFAIESFGEPVRPSISRQTNRHLPDVDGISPHDDTSLPPPPEDSIAVAIDDYGNIMDATMPDGRVGFTVGPHDHIVVVSRTLNQVFKGSKADFLDEDGKLDVLRACMPDHHDEIERTRAAIEEHDPSNGVLVVRLPEFKTATIPLDAFGHGD